MLRVKAAGSVRPPATRVLKQLALLGLVAAGLLIAGCGGDEKGTVRAAGAPKPVTAGLPKPLAANAKQANLILDGPGDLLQKKLSPLRGYPVVVNQWASWCEPCRFEFPFFQAAATTHRKDVAFLGLDMQDTKKGGKKFLEEIPAPFPSIFDPDAAYITSLGGGRASPTTVFIKPDGQVAFVHPGAYASEAALEADIATYAKPKSKT
jgi:cytochrome c biogenesis protein CcmG, thiol:disulfide interchange protein DsbE